MGKREAEQATLPLALLVTSFTGLMLRVTVLLCDRATSDLC